jgi:hypothetical protein
MKGQTLEERFWEKVDIEGEDDCWEWTRYKQSRGYGEFWLSEEKPHKLAHRQAYELAIISHAVIHLIYSLELPQITRQT